MQIDLSYNMLPAQKVLHDALHYQGKRFLLYVGGRRAGKTFWAAPEAWYLALRYGGLGWIVAPSYKVSKAPQDMFDDRCPNRRLIKRYRQVDREYLLINGAKIEIRTADDPNLLRGRALQWIWMDEGADVSGQCFKILRACVSSTNGIIMITTTPRGRNWLYHDFYKHTLDNPLYIAATARTGDNPYIPKSEVEDMRKLYRGKFAQQELDAEFVSFQGLVYDCFDYETCVLRGRIDASKLNDVKWGAGIDFGWQHPSVYLLRAKVGNIYWYLEEIYQSKLDTKIFAEMIRDTEKKYNINPNEILRFADSTSPRERIDLAKAGIRTIPAQKEPGEVIRGIRIVYGLIEDGKLRVHERCKNLLDEIGNYAYPEHSVKSSGEMPKGIDDHAVDAMRYDITGGEKLQGIRSREMRYRAPKAIEYI